MPGRSNCSSAVRRGRIASITARGALRRDPRFIVDIIGTISKPTGASEAGPDGVEVPVFETFEGFHANLGVLWPEIDDDPDAPIRLLSEAAEAALEPYVIPAPATPFRIWA